MSKTLPISLAFIALLLIGMVVFLKVNVPSEGITAWMLLAT